MTDLFIFVNMRKHLPFAFLFFLCRLVFLGQTKSDSLLNAIQKHPEKDTVRIKLLDDYIYILQNGHPNEVVTYAEEMLEISKKINYLKGESNAYFYLSDVYKQYGNNEKALELAKKALAIDEQQKDSAKICSSLNRLGNLAKSQGDFTGAVKFFFSALSYISGDNVARRKTGTLINIGTVFYDQKNMQQAMQYYTEALDLAQKNKDTSNTAYVKIDIALVYEEQQKMDLALRIYFDVIKLLGKRDIKAAASVYSNMAGVYYFTHKIDSCLYYALQTKSMRLQIGDTVGVVEININIASIYAEQKKYGEAIKMFEEGIVYCKKTKHLNLLQAIYKDLADTYGDLHEYEKAYQYQKLFIALKDSVYSMESSKQVANMQVKYDLDKKEAEISLLNKDKELSRSEILRQRVIEFGLIILVALLVVIALVALRAFRTKQKSNEQLTAKNEEIALQRNMVEEKNKEITDSIRYASRIQRALITSEKYIEKNLQKLKKD